MDGITTPVGGATTGDFGMPSDAELLAMVPKGSKEELAAQEAFLGHTRKASLHVDTIQALLTDLHQKVGSVQDQTLAVQQAREGLQQLVEGYSLHAIDGDSKNLLLAAYRELTKVAEGVAALDLVATPGKYTADVADLHQLLTAASEMTPAELSEVRGNLFKASVVMHKLGNGEADDKAITSLHEHFTAAEAGVGQGKGQPAGLRKVLKLAGDKITTLQVHPAYGAPTAALRGQLETVHSSLQQAINRITRGSFLSDVETVMSLLRSMPRT